MDVATSPTPACRFRSFSARTIAMSAMSGGLIAGPATAWSESGGPSTSPDTPASASMAAPASSTVGSGWSLRPGLILDGGFASGELPMSWRGKGFGLGHNELLIDGSVDAMFKARLAVAAHQHHGSTEFDIEEAWLDAHRMPVGLQLRMGRFMPQVGYLNEQHPHADDFSDRPAMYRAFFGSHWKDTGVRLNWVAPTDRYWRVGAELLQDTGLIGTPAVTKSLGAWTLSTKIGDDWGLEHSWQLGLAWVGNRLDPQQGTNGAIISAERPDAEWEAHAPLFTGRNMAIVDGVWKWAPGGNNQRRQLRLSGEFARISRPADMARVSGDGSGSDRAWYLSAVYRFAPQWETGLRYSRVDARMATEDAAQAGAGRWGESSLMLAWKPSHMSAVRLQYSHATMGGAFDQPGSVLTSGARHAVMLQFVGSLGAHPAHSY